MNKIDSTLLKENIDSKVCILNCQKIKSTQSQAQIHRARL